MMKETYSAFKLALIFLIVPLLSNCVAVQPFPIAARAGDTITLAAGSPDGMTKSNTQLLYTPDGGVGVDLPIRAIIKLLPDPTSRTATYDANIRSLASYTGHSQTLSIIVADLPSGWSPGTGAIKILTTADYGTYGGNPDLNTLEIPFEILPGTGEPNTFSYKGLFNQTYLGYLQNLEPLPQVIVKAPIYPLFGAPNGFAAGEIKVNVPIRNISNGNPVLASSVKVINDSVYPKNTDSQLSMMWKKEGDEFTIIYSGPTQTKFYEQTRFSIVWDSNTNEVADPNSLQVTSVKFYDVNGFDLMPNTNGVAIPRASDYAISLEYTD